MALGDIHYLANMLDHRFLGQRISPDKKTQAYNYLRQVSSDLLPILLSHCSSDHVFPSYLYEASLKKMQPIIWWKSVNLEDSRSFDWTLCRPMWMKICEQLLSACATTATVERTFSTFGLVQSKLRNSLGIEKAAKLTFMFKHLNQSTTKKTNLDWIWEQEEEEEPEDEESEVVVQISSDEDDGEDEDEDDNAEEPTQGSSTQRQPQPTKRSAAAAQMDQDDDDGDSN
jgi:hypothetical protein